MNDDIKNNEQTGQTPGLKNYKAYPKYDSTNPNLINYAVKPLFARKVSDIIIAVFLCLLSIFGVSAVFWDNLSVGYTIVFCISFILISAFLLKNGKKAKPVFLVCGILALACSLSFSVTSNMGIKFVAFVITAVSSIIWFSSAAGNEYKISDYSLFEYALSAVINAFVDLPATLKSFFSRGEKKSKNTIAVLVGVACALPALAIIVPLLARSDEAFSALLQKLVSNFAEEITKIILGLAVSVIVIACVFSLKYNKKGCDFKTVNFNISKITICTFLSILSFVYVVYLVTQLAYFFSAFSSILPEGYKFTYAGYARRGFFELCAIAAINFAIIFAAVILTEKRADRIPVAVKIPASLTVIFTIIIIFTALSKMLMYMNAYALTVSRICASAFIIWLLVLYIGIFVRLFFKKLDILTTGLILALIIVSILGTSNINYRIARYNYNSYINYGKEIDVEYISRLDDEGIPCLYLLTKDKNSEIADKAKAELSYQYVWYYDLGDKDLSDLNSYDDFTKLKKSKGEIGKFTIALSNAYDTLDKYAKEQDGKVYFNTQDEIFYD